MMVNKNRSENREEKAQRSSLEYIECLEEERRKIQVFQRELPLCLDLVSQAIETCRKEINFPGKSESFEPTSKGGPVLEEFIPTKNVFSFSVDEDEQHKYNDKGKNVVSDDDCGDDKSTKMDWLKSVQLWQHTPDQPNDKDPVREVSITGSQRNGSGGAFQPFKKDKRVESSAQPLVTNPNVNSTAESGSRRGGGSSKPRRCWSQELHRRFLVALEELGGAYVATPKQIRQKMKVDGLTNDEVKSHLQKYRLHEKPSSSSSTQETQTQSNVLPPPPPPPPQTAPQFVVLGGLWVPQMEYARTVARTSQTGEGTETTMLHSPPDGIYAPKALRAQPPPEDEATPLPKKRKQNIEFQSTNSTRCHHKGIYGSNSSATSSSTHTTTASRIAQLLQ